MFFTFDYALHKGRNGMLPASNDWTERSRQLLAAADAGDTSAIGEALELVRGYLLRIAENEIRVELRAKVNPSDVVQDTFLEACRIYSRFQGTQSEELQAWLRAILLNKLNNLHKQYFQTEKRRVGREQSLDDSHNARPLREEIPAPNLTPSGHAVRNEESQSLNTAMARLPEHYRQVLVWRTYDHISFAEIGHRLNRSEAAAHMLYARALERLQDEINPDELTRRPDGAHEG